MGFLEKFFKEEKKKRREKKRLEEKAKESKRIRAREGWKRKERREKALLDAE